MVIMPDSAPVTMILRIEFVSPFLMRLRIAAFTRITSVARTRPRLSALARSCWEITPWSVMESWRRTWFCAPEGKTSMILSMLWIASFVWSVASTHWPVSAAVRAAAIVSRSRISPSMITSGSWRSTCFRASAKEWVSSPISRCSTMLFLFSWRYSIGSSMVMTWQVRE